MDLEALATIAVDCGFSLHQRLGPGLLESVYEAVLNESLAKRGLPVQRQVPIPIVFDDLYINEGCRWVFSLTSAQRPSRKVSYASSTTTPISRLRVFA